MSLVEALFSFEHGISITAVDEADARRLGLWANADEMPIAHIRRVLNAANLDELHVTSNMGTLLKRGVWYSRGIEQLA